MVKQSYIDVFIDDSKLTLYQFGQYIIREYQTDDSMSAVRQLYGSMLAILPTAMVLENWNSISTLVWSDLRKLMETHSIADYVTAKVNGPPTAKYDSRIVASKITSNSIIRSIDVQKNMDQPHLKSFFRHIKKNNDEYMTQIKQMQNVDPMHRNVNNMKTH